MKNINKKVNNIVHFIGIGGIGMSGIAELMLDQGFIIQGSDLHINENIKRLKKKGAKIFLGHRKSNIKDIKVAVFSSAINSNNPEFVACKKLSIPLLRRADMLAEIIRGKKAIAVAGSHGKTTTTSLIGTILDSSNLDPTIINGGIINAYSKNNRFGFGKWVVVEADESDGSFLKIPHDINIITNIDLEHMDYYKNKKNLLKSFESFLTNIPFYGYSILCTDNKNLCKLSKKIKNKRIIKYGFNDSADVKIVDHKIIKSRSYFSIYFKKNIISNLSGIYNFETNLLGKHNILNATGSLIASLIAGSSINSVRLSLKNFLGVKRRFSFLGKKNKSFIYDDYAHHPTEIKASYEIANILNKKNVIVVFQPHRFSRTQKLFKEFIKVLSKIKILYILDIYPAGEKRIKKINSKKIVKIIKEKNKSAHYISKKENINKVLSKYYNDENLIVFMGAGSITHLANSIIKK